MFQKEGSCTDIVSTSSSKRGGGKPKSKGKGNKGKQQPTSRAQSSEEQTTTSKAVDVPLRKSDRRKLRQRASAYFFGSNAHHSAGDGNNDDAMDSSNTPDQNPMDTLLDEIFLRGGTLSSRSLPKLSNTTESHTKGNHENMVLYVKSPSSDSESEHSFWPYQKKTQFVWMALEDKKSGTVIHESPSVALLAAIYHTVFSFDLEEQETAAAATAAFRSDLERTRIVTIHPPVSRYLCRGADLMRAGIISAPSKPENPGGGEPRQPIGGNQTKNQKKKDRSSVCSGGNGMVAVCARGNPQPFAVGRSVLWSNDSDGSYGYGTKGVGVEIWNCFGDDLWRTTIAGGGQSGILPNLEDGSYGNPGFCTGKELFVVSLVADEESDDEEKDENDSAGGNGTEPTNELASATSPWDAASNDENEETVTEIASDARESPPSESVGDGESGPNSLQAISGDVGDESETNAETEAVETEDAPSPDETLHTAVCQALVNLRKNDLPMSVGIFYTKHVLPNKPEGLESADLMKLTTYKKFGNYLKEWQLNDRDDSGLIETGPDPKNRNNRDPNAVLISFNRRHGDLHGMKKTKPGGAASGTVADGNQKIVLVKLHVVPHQWTDLLRLDPEEVRAGNASSEARRGTGLLTLPEARKLLDGYLQRESSLLVSKTTVALDGPLTDALFGKKAKGPTPEQLSRKELSKRFVDRLSPAYCLVRMPGSHVVKLGRGTPPAVQIEVVKRQSKKFVTRLRGLEEYLGCDGAWVDSTDFCRNVSKRLAISGSVDSNPESSGRAALPKKGFVEYVFGANIADELEALLTGDESLSNHGAAKGGWAYPRIPGAAIEVILRKGVPARKGRRGGSRR